MKRNEECTDLTLTRGFSDDAFDTGFLTLPFSTELLYDDTDLKVIDKPREVIVHADMPGFRKEDISVTSTGEWISIWGNHRTEAKRTRGRGNLEGCSEESFNECVRLPGGVRTESMKASFKQGVLEIRVPKIVSGKERKLTVH